MKFKITNQFLIQYIIMFLISLMVGGLSFLLLDFSNHVISRTLIKNNLTADDLMRNDYQQINTDEVINNGGGVQVINENLEIVLTKGITTFTTDKLSMEELTQFLITSKSKGVTYSYSIQYNKEEKFWLVITFPTSIRIDFAIVHNKEYTSVDTHNVIGVVFAIILFYLLLLGFSTVVYSKITSIGIVNPLKMLSNAARNLRDGDYSTRVKLNLKNEFGELEDTFNTMASEIQKEITLRKQSEENRKNLVLDISHDLKNPLASIMGYAELLRNSGGTITLEENMKYLNIIYENSKRANNLIMDLFEFSKLDSNDFIITKTKTDICEFLRVQMVSAIDNLDEAGFHYEFIIPDDEIMIPIDTRLMTRVFDNLTHNTIKYNSKGTKVLMKLRELEESVVITFSDNGIGIPSYLTNNIFEPFVRVDPTRNYQSGGSGLGLAIVNKIITAHKGALNLITDVNCGCEFIITLPKI